MDCSEVRLDTIEAQKSTEFLCNLQVSDLFDFPGEYVLISPEIFSAIPIHAASRAGYLAIVETLVASVTYFSGRLSVEERERLNLYDLQDRDADTAMHLALTGHHVEIAACLVNVNQCASFFANKDGVYISIVFGCRSCKERPHQNIKEILKRCPDSKQLLNNHDVDGNTPLHLATIKWRPRALTLLSRVSGSMRNNSGLTALDIAESNLQPNYIFRERVTLLVLVYCYALRECRLQWTKKPTRSSEPLNHGKNKEYISALLLVAALVATVTFAAGFTIPGGFNDSAPNLGMATLAKDPSLFYFLVFDTLVMQSAVVTIATLIWAQLGEPALAHRSLYIALPSLFFALFCMLCAFYFGVVNTIGHVRGLVIVISVIYIILFLVMHFVLAPHVVLQMPGIPAFFGIFFLHFMWFVNDNDIDDELCQKSDATMSMKISCKD
ncbi:unnamed protein product [Cochlearia groenlandica]